MNKKPMVSVIVPVHNQGRLLSQTIASLRGQTWQNWECIIVNDGSTDNTEHVAQELCSIDSRLSYKWKENGGSASARNFGVRFAQGSFVLFLDGDDLIMPNKIEKSLKMFSDNPNIDVVATNFEMCSSDGSKKNPPFCILKHYHFSHREILLNWDKTFAFPPHCCIYRIELFQGYDFNQSLKAKEDWVMALQIFKSVRAASFIDEPLAIYRSHPGSKRQRPDYYLDVSNTFEFVMMNEVSSDDRDAFFLKVNQYWMQMIRQKIGLIHVLQNSTSFKIGNSLIRPFLFLKKFGQRRRK